MINILFDLISIQGYHSGGGEYVLKVLKELSLCSEANIIGIYDSKLNFLNDDTMLCFREKTLLDIQKYTIAEMICNHHIEVIFIGIIQRYAIYNLNNINCKVICVVHDIGNVEVAKNRIYYLYPQSWRVFFKIVFDYFFPQCCFSVSTKVLKQYNLLRNFLIQDNVSIITVSYYTKSSLLYYFPELSKKNVEVLYPPEKIYICNNIVENLVLKNFFSTNRKYLLFVNANRENKNFDIVIRCFSRIRQVLPDIYMIVTGAKKRKQEANIIYLDYVSNSDIEHLYQKAWALIYPSFTEGFGYPPIEAMKYSTPVVSSNVCSMAEVLEASAVFFSPFYENELCNKLEYLKANYQNYKELSQRQYLKISQRQKKDFEQLINRILI